MQTFSPYLDIPAPDHWSGAQESAFDRLQETLKKTDTIVEIERKGE